MQTRSKRRAEQASLVKPDRKRRREIKEDNAHCPEERKRLLAEDLYEKLATTRNGIKIVRSMLHTEEVLQGQLFKDICMTVRTREAAIRVREQHTAAMMRIINVRCQLDHVLKSLRDIHWDVFHSEHPANATD